MHEEDAQAATEYLLLVALGLAVLIVAVGVALELRSLTDVVTARVRTERNDAIATLVR